MQQTGKVKCILENDSVKNIFDLNVHTDHSNVGKRPEKDTMKTCKHLDFSEGLPVKKSVKTYNQYTNN